MNTRTLEWIIDRIRTAAESGMSGCVELHLQEGEVRKITRVEHERPPKEGETT